MAIKVIICIYFTPSVFFLPEARRTDFEQRLTWCHHCQFQRGGETLMLAACPENLLEILLQWVTPGDSGSRV
jgi:hypothetical protein